MRASEACLAGGWWGEIAFATRFACTRATVGRAAMSTFERCLHQTSCIHYIYNCGRGLQAGSHAHTILIHFGTRGVSCVAVVEKSSVSIRATV